MKIIKQMIFTIVLAFVLGQFLPFWSVVIAGFVVGYLVKTGSFSSFIAGFLGIALLWGFSAWFMSSGNEGILLERIANLFTLSPMLLLVVTSVIGGVLGGFAAVSGTQLRLLIFPKRRDRRNPYYGV